jgi:hypothetical protein
MSKNFILTIYQNPKTVFSIKELSQLFPNISYQSLKDRLSYAVKTKKLQKPRRGIYTKSNYNPFELANKIYTPSYISLETVLLKEGIIFQEKKEITLVSYLTRTIKINDQIIISYRKIKDPILNNLKGIVKNENYFIAEKERAFLDAIFLFKDFHFDNLNLDWEKVFETVKIYQNKKLEKRVNEYYKIYKKEYA